MLNWNRHSDTRFLRDCYLSKYSKVSGFEHSLDLVIGRYYLYYFCPVLMRSFRDIIILIMKYSSANLSSSIRLFLMVKIKAFFKKIYLNYNLHLSFHSALFILFYLLTFYFLHFYCVYIKIFTKIRFFFFSLQHICCEIR